MLKIADILLQNAEEVPNSVDFDNSFEELNKLRLHYAKRILEETGRPNIYFFGKPKSYNLWFYKFRFNGKYLSLLLCHRQKIET